MALWSLGNTLGTVVVTLAILVMVPLWWHCDDTVVTVVATVFIVLALW